MTQPLSTQHPHEIYANDGGSSSGGYGQPEPFTKTVSAYGQSEVCRYGQQEAKSSPFSFSDGNHVNGGREEAIRAMQQIMQEQQQMGVYDNGEPPGAVDRTPPPASLIHGATKRLSQTNVMGFEHVKIKGGPEAAPKKTMPSASLPDRSPPAAHHQTWPDSGGPYSGVQGYSGVNTYSSGPDFGGAYAGGSEWTTQQQPPGGAYSGGSEWTTQQQPLGGAYSGGSEWATQQQPYPYQQAPNYFEQSWDVRNDLYYGQGGGPAWQPGWPPQGPPPPRPPPPRGKPPFIQGWLMKRGPKSDGDYRLRHCRLENCNLTYSKDCNTDKPKGSIEIHKNCIAKNFGESDGSSAGKLAARMHPFGFEINCGAALRTWYFDAGARDKRDAWVNAINNTAAWSAAAAAAEEPKGWQAFRQEPGWSPPPPMPKGGGKGKAPAGMNGAMVGGFAGAHRGGPPPPMAYGAAGYPGW